MNDYAWLWMGLGMACFAVGLVISRLRARRRMLQRVREKITEEASRRVQEQILDELRRSGYANTGQSRYQRDEEHDD